MKAKATYNYTRPIIPLGMIRSVKRKNRSHSRIPLGMQPNSARVAFLRNAVWTDGNVFLPSDASLRDAKVPSLRGRHDRSNPGFDRLSHRDCFAYARNDDKKPRTESQGD